MEIFIRKEYRVYYVIKLFSLGIPMRSDKTVICSIKECILNTFRAISHTSLACKEPGCFSQYSDYTTGWTTGAGVSLPHRVHTGSGVHPASSSISTRCKMAGD
jgi:hypothetical protein